MKNFTKSNYTTKWIPVGQISVVYPAAQRVLKEKRARDIANNLDPDAFGTIEVCEVDGSDKYHAIDGQARVRAIQMLWGDNEKVPCNVIAADEKRAAHIFTLINGPRVKPGAVESFLVAVTAGHGTEVEIDKMLRSMGHKIAMDMHPGTIRAVGSVLDIWKRWGPEIFRRTLEVLQATWGKEVDAYDGVLLKGFARFLFLFPEGNLQRLHEKVAKLHTPRKLIGVAKASRDIHRGSVDFNVTRALVAIYNHGLRNEKLRLSLTDRP